MSNGGAAVGALAKLASGAVITGALMQGAALAWLWSFGPHGFAQTRPHCDAQQVCVVVAGLKDDVSLGFGASGQIVGLDVRDDTAQRLVDDLDVMTSDGRQVRVLRYPVEIGLPAAGADNAAELPRVLAQARSEGRSAGASLVVIGRVVNDDYVTLAFVDPSSSTTEVSRIQYQLGDAESRSALLAFLSASIAAVGSDEPLPQAPRAILPTPVRPADPMPEPTPAKPEEVTFVQPTEPRAAIISPAHVRTEPSIEQMERAYPARALRRGVAGRVVLRCQVELDGRLSQCAVLSEEPRGYGFAEAAIRLAEQDTVGFPQLVDNAPAAGGQLDVPYVFRVRNE
jgi:protein TonB